MAVTSGTEYWTSAFWKRKLSAIPTSYTVFKNTDDSKYYAECNVIGGTNFSGTDATTVINSVIATNTKGKICFKPATYQISSSSGIVLNNIDDVVFSAPFGAKIQYTGASGDAQLLSVEGGSENIIWDGFTFDMRRGVTPNPSGAGLAWIVRMVGASKNLTFDHCQFLNGNDCGIVSGGNSSGLFVLNSILDNFGEHPIYLENTTNVVASNLRVLNWAKFIRGYMPKLSNVDHAVFEKIYCQGNEDGLGYPVAGGFGDYGCYGPVVAGGSEHVTFRHVRYLGDGTENVTLDVEGATTTGILFDDVQWINHGAWAFYNRNAKTATTELKNCLITKAKAGTSTATLWENCRFIDPPQLLIDVDDVDARNCKWVREDAVHNYELIDVNANNVHIDKPRFYNWTYRGIWADGSEDLRITNMYVDGGVTSSWLKWGTRTQLVGSIWKNYITNGAVAINDASGSNCRWSRNAVPTALTLTLSPSTFDCDSVIVPFVGGTDPQDSGFLVNGVADMARAYLFVPSFVRKVLGLKIYARVNSAEADSMLLNITVNGGSDNEGYTAEVVSLANQPSTTTNFAGGDVAYWLITPSDDADIGDLARGDSIEVKVIYVGAGGGNTETDGYFRTVEMLYV